MIRLSEINVQKMVLYVINFLKARKINARFHMDLIKLFLIKILQEQINVLVRILMLRLVQAYTNLISHQATNRFFKWHNF